MEGVRFQPQDVELVRDYLYRKVRGKRLPSEGVIIECDLYGTENPWQVWERYRGNVVKAFHNDEDLYVFTKLKRKHDETKDVERKMGIGCWEGGEGGAKKIIDGTNRCIGFMKRFRFERSKTNHDGKWIMHQYSLHPSMFPSHLRQQMRDYVVCRIRKNDGRNRLHNKRKEPHSSKATEELDHIKSRKLQKDDIAPNKPHNHHHLAHDQKKTTKELDNSKSIKLQKVDIAPNKGHNHHDIHLGEQNEQTIQQQHQENQPIQPQSKEAELLLNLDDEESFNLPISNMLDDQPLFFEPETDSSMHSFYSWMDTFFSEKRMEETIKESKKETSTQHHLGQENQQTILQQHPSGKHNPAIQEADFYSNLDNEEFFSMPISNMLDDQPLFFEQETDSPTHNLNSWTDTFFSGQRIQKTSLAVL